MQKNIGSFVFIIITAALITAAGIIWHQDFFKTLPLYVSLFVGMLQAKASRFASLLGGINCLLYTAVYISFSLYAQAASTLFISCTFQIATFIRWSKHKYKNSTRFRKLGVKGRLLVAGAFAVSFIAVYTLLSAADSSYRLLDASITLFSITISFLTLFSFIEYSYLMLCLGFISIMLDITMIPDHNGQVTYLIYSVYSLICIIRQFFAVKRLYKEQQNQKGNSNMKVIYPKATHGTVNRVTDSLFSYQGWPTVARDENGTLYAVASSFRISHICPFGKTAMYISRNGGKSWTPPIIINDSCLDDRDAGILYLGNGKMIVSWFCHPANRYAEGEWNEFIKMAAPDAARDAAMGMLEGYKFLKDDVKEGGSFIKISNDYGVTWSDKIKVPISAPHGPNSMKDGSIGYVGTEAYSNGELPEGSIAYYKSFDGGYTWKKISVIARPEWLKEGECISEPHVIELPNGRLLAAFRIEDSKPLCVAFTHSDDGGISWSEVERSDCWGGPPHLMLHSSGALICSCGYRENPFGEHAFISRDMGESFEAKYILDESKYHDLGYPSTVELDDGSLLTVYYQKYCDKKGDDLTPSILYTHWHLK